jgi:hypothetical protein
MKRISALIVALAVMVAPIGAGAAATAAETDAECLARMLYGEARGIASDMEKAACVWVALNRVDAGYADTVQGVVKAPKQFVGYKASHPIWDDLLALAEDVLARWAREKDGEENVGRVLPPDYLWFTGDGKRNRFRNEYIGGDRWDWRLPDPYADEKEVTDDEQ